MTSISNISKISDGRKVAQRATAELFESIRQAVAMAPVAPAVQDLNLSDPTTQYMRDLKALTDHVGGAVFDWIRKIARDAEDYRCTESFGRFGVAQDDRAIFFEVYNDLLRAIPPKEWEFRDEA